MDVRVRKETWAYYKPFIISRGAKNAEEVAVVELSDGMHTGRGEAVSSSTLNETCESVINQIRPDEP